MRNRIVIALILLLFPPCAMAATYYAEPKGSIDLDDNTSGTGTGTIEDPWSIGQAMVEVEAGDTVIFAAGTYYGGQNNGLNNTGYYNPSNSGTLGNPITFKAADEATVYIHGTPSVTHTYVLGNGHHDYIVFDGFTLITGGGDAFNGIIIAGESEDYADGCIVRNCTFPGSETTSSSTDNQSAIFYTFTNDLLIENCTIYNFKGQNQNTSGTKSYSTNRTIIQNCEIYNCTAGIYLKSRNDGDIIRYNYIHDCGTGIEGSTNMYYESNIKVYHNIIANCSKFLLHTWGESDVVDDWDVYNNTFYNASAPGDGVVNLTAGSGYESDGYIVRNNVFQTPVATGDTRTILRFYGIACETGGFDYNAYGQYISVTQAGTAYTSLAAIQGATIAGLTEGNHNVNSVDGAIVFVNTSGSMSTIADFALASNSPGYQAGSDGKDMGADVTLVGTGAEGGEDPPAPSGTATIRASGTAGWR